jgi:hypothetical protein
MPAHCLQDLVDEFSSLIGANAPSLAVGPDGMLAFSTKVDGFDVTVTHDPSGRSEDAIVYFFFGSLPYDREIEALTGLLGANLQMRAPRAPSFALDAKKRQVVLKYPYELARASGNDLLEGLHAIAREASRWEENLFSQPSPSLSMFDHRA